MDRQTVNPWIIYRVRVHFTGIKELNIHYVLVKFIQTNFLNKCILQFKLLEVTYNNNNPLFFSRPLICLIYGALLVCVFTIRLQSTEVKIRTINGMKFC